MGTFGRRPFKFASEDKVRLGVHVDIPGTEYDILLSYAAGNTIKHISCETGTDFMTVRSTIRKNLKTILGV